MSCHSTRSPCSCSFAHSSCCWQAIREWIAKEADQETADAIRIQYGGSANAQNAPELSSFPDIDGFLVGGASLKPEISDIVKAIAEAKV